MSFLPDRALDHLRDVTGSPDFSATRYQPEEEIGRGGMGTVYAAWDAQLDRRVALKVMNPATSSIRRPNCLPNSSTPESRPFTMPGFCPMAECITPCA
ncbi:MAG: hypothetical protein WDO73_11100 [Ignavibacteriota bacterium]